jgi:hypothetical protein
MGTDQRRQEGRFGRVSRKIGLPMLFVCVLIAGMLGSVVMQAGTAGAATPTWSIVASPNVTGATDSSLQSVACSSTTSCMAVGFSNSGSASLTLVESWNGTSWSIVASPNPAGAIDSSLQSVACSSATSCTAVGYSTNASGEATLVESWDGTSWSIVASPNPAGAIDSSLQSVACSSATSCTAVGNFSNASGSPTLVESWNGTSWSIVASPNPSGGSGDLLGVACSSATSCTAVGYSQISVISYQTLVESWNGTSWSIVASPNNTGRGNFLYGVACSSATSCTAVGSSTYGVVKYTIQTLVESWDGTSWSIVTSPNVAGAVYSSFQSVACSSATSCTAVGYSSNSSSSIDQMLVGSWDGTSWSIVASPNPAGGSGDLLGVACSSATSCTAVGESSSDGGITEQTLTAWTGRADATAPPVVVSSSVSPTTVTAGSPTTVSWEVTSGASLTFNRVLLYEPGGNELPLADCADPTQVSGTATDGHFQEACTVPDGLANGVYTTNIQVDDSLGNVILSSGPSITVTGSVVVAPPPPPPPQPPAVKHGYDLVGSDGGVFVFGGGFYGSLPGIGLHVNNINGIVPTSTDNGYFLVGSDGGVFAFNAPFANSLPGIGVHVNNIVGIVPTLDDQGYFLVGRDGGVFSFNAPFENSLPGIGIHVNDIVGIAVTADDQGYWLVGADGTVYAFGDAHTYGNAPAGAVGITVTHDGGGYWVVGANGSVTAFGDAGKFGDLPSIGVSVKNIVGIVVSPDSQGYNLFGSDGGVFSFGDAQYQGSLPGLGVRVNNVVGAVPT